MRNSKLIPWRIESAEPTEPPKIDTTAFGRILERGARTSRGSNESVDCPATVGRVDFSWRQAG
jgi:hypothetical protein